MSFITLFYYVTGKERTTFSAIILIDTLNWDIIILITSSNGHKFICLPTLTIT